jgi:hypothetical protein
MNDNIAIRDEIQRGMRKNAKSELTKWLLISDRLIGPYLALVEGGNCQGQSSSGQEDPASIVVLGSIHNNRRETSAGSSCRDTATGSAESSSRDHCLSVTNKLDLDVRLLFKGGFSSGQAIHEHVPR